MGVVHLALQLLRLASEALFLFELNKTLGALVIGSRATARKQSVAAEKEVLSHAGVETAHETVTLPDGTTLHTLMAGAEGGGAVVLLHGHSMCAALFYTQLHALVEGGARVYAPDLPGWGRSSRPRFCGVGSAAGVAYYARRVLQWLDALALRRFALVGHSLGAYLAHEVALARPSAVRTLVLAAPAATARAVPYASAFWFSLTPQRFLAQGGLLAALLFFARYPREPCYARPGVRAIIRASNMLGSGAGDAAAAAMLRVRHLAFGAECDRPLVERVRKLPCAVTLVAGEHDVLVPIEAIYKLADALSAAENMVNLAVLSGADHSPHISTPELFGKVLKSAVLPHVLPEDAKV